MKPLRMPNLLRSSRLGALLLAAGVALLALPVVAWAQAARGPSFGGFFNVDAQASGVTALFGNPQSEPYPVAAGQIGETQARLGTGPAGWALSSVVWPGPLVGNGARLLTLLIPTDERTKPLIGTASYPVRAEAQASGLDGHDEATVGPMSARVEGETSEAKSTLADFRSQGVVSVARVITRSRNFAQDGRVISIGESTLEGVELAGGQVTIDTIRTIARASTDGVGSDTEHSIAVHGLEIDGRRARVDEKGVHFGDDSHPNPAQAAVGELNKQLLSRFGIEMFLTRPVTDEGEGGKARVHSGSLAIVWTLGSGPNHVVLTLGGAAARVSATPGLALTPPPVDDFVGGDVPTEPGFEGGTQVGGVEFVQSPSAGEVAAPAPAPATGTVQAPTGGIPPRIEGTPVSFFRGIGAGWVIVAVLGALLVGGGLRRLRHAALAAGPTGVRCPLERREP